MGLFLSSHGADDCSLTVFCKSAVQEARALFVPAPMITTRLKPVERKRRQAASAPSKKPHHLHHGSVRGLTTTCNAYVDYMDNSNLNQRVRHRNLFVHKPREYLEAKCRENNSQLSWPVYESVRIHVGNMWKAKCVALYRNFRIEGHAIEKDRLSALSAAANEVINIIFDMDRQREAQSRSRMLKDRTRSAPKRRPLDIKE